LRLLSAEDPSSVCKKGGYNHDQKYHQHRHDAYTAAASTTIIVGHYRFLPALKSNIEGKKIDGLAPILSEMWIKRIVCRRGNTRTGDTKKPGITCKGFQLQEGQTRQKARTVRQGAVPLTASVRLLSAISARRWPLRPVRLLLAVQLCGKV